jgi:predicted kinase
MNKRITILIGCSGSGKSTWAKAQWELDPLNTIIVGRDGLRELLFGSCGSDYYETDGWHKLEEVVSKYEYIVIEQALKDGKHIIADNTHLSEKYLKRYDFWNVPLTYKTFPTTLEQAVANDRSRSRNVGEEIIRKQIERFNKLKL